MNVPEIEVRTFKQQGGESLKDAWYRICDAHHRCTKKYSTMILLRNFYVGISTWNRYVLDTLIGGNFLGAPASEVYVLIESLGGSPPINVAKTEITLEEVVKRLDSLEKSLPNLLFDAIHTNELIGGINKKLLFWRVALQMMIELLELVKLKKLWKLRAQLFPLLVSKRRELLLGKNKNLCTQTKNP
jgi:hypothetical protein